MGEDINDKQAAHDWQSKKTQYRNLDVLIQAGEFTLARLPPASSIPTCVLNLLSEPLKPGGEPFFCTVSRTHEELSILVSTSTGLAVKELEKAVGPSEGGHGLDGPWKAFRIRGPMEFHLVGVLLEFSRCLAQRAISIFAISTWDTDYICVKEDNFANACQALKDDGWNVLDKTD
ncbi:GATS-like ACT domain protein [Kalmanozyma brasiliensis GHG001]|uniref:GATS-like ACT domain protein n=1 Tax=Kalmanozyma brasiliensis (strain GHG001) TaxID=1365824 RepID=UPI00286805D4|nr:GATS-like ACT domain protein [Kalmanozyma brasiliensis GHG001]EST09956.2 GATS-like ACT domain protein [Kalmanozyma brasiliensis GHG001]